MPVSMQGSYTLRRLLWQEATTYLKTQRNTDLDIFREASDLEQTNGTKEKDGKSMLAPKQTCLLEGNFEASGSTPIAWLNTGQDIIDLNCQDAVRTKARCDTLLIS